MAEQEVARLFRAAQSNPGLRESLSQAPDLDTFITMAKSVGFHFTVEEWQSVTRFHVEELKCEMSEIPGI